MKLSTKKRLNSVLGLTLADGQLRAAHATRTKTGSELANTASAALSLDLLHPEAELVGREIKNHLDAAGIPRAALHRRSARARWVMSQPHPRHPSCRRKDMASFPAARGGKRVFPRRPGAIADRALVPNVSAAGTYVTQLGVRKEQLDQTGPPR